MRQVVSSTSETVATAASVGASTPVNVKQAVSVALATAVTVTTPSAGTFTAVAATDVMTKVGHGGLTGLKVQVSNSGGALPSGLAAVTDYFMIKIDADTFKLASSLVNAQAGTAIDITTNGTGTQTITPTAIAGASVKLQGCLDGDTPTASSVWADVPIGSSGDATKSGSITATANFLLSEIDPEFNWLRSYYTLTAGQISAVQTTLVKGDS